MKNLHKQRGFTIVELMIATAVFSTILLVILTAITQVGRMYYKGITTAHTQEAARTIMDRISQETQFSGSSSVPTKVLGSSRENGVLCIGKTRFFFVVNKISRTNQHALWVDTDNGGSNTGCTSQVVDSVITRMNSDQPTQAANNGSEFLPEGMRLSMINIDGSGDVAQPLLWAIDIKIAYGENDLLEADDGSDLTPENAATAVCKGSQIGTQFCAVSKLSTTVLKRVL